VLGHFPTGVVVVTAMSDDDSPVGMAVGSFSSVSLDPPLVAFLPDRSSTTFPHIRGASSFCINVLAADQEDVCRVFALRGADKFHDVRWSPSPSGAPVLDGVVAWIDCIPGQIHEAGDHFIVIGRVTAMDVARATIPLLFFQGGYGAFAPRSLVTGARADLEQQVRLADLARAGLEGVTDDLGVETRAAAVVGDQQVIVAVVQPGGASDWHTAIGLVLPFVPPWNTTYLAWLDDGELDSRCALASPPIAGDRRAALDAEIAVIRRHGWSLKYRDDDEIMRLIDELEHSLETSGPLPGLERDLTSAVARLTPHADPDLLDDDNAGRVFTVAVPVFDGRGRVPMLLLASHLPDHSTVALVEQLRDRLSGVARDVTRRISGRAPASYADARIHHHVQHHHES
jgi:flavin reductase (DIM6/NTAB) family NADH-FMN oxidoreductase RutF/DNA-binding IclR family transcriptional regulator